MTMDEPDFLDINDTQRIAYHKIDGQKPGIIFLCGHGSDMQGTKSIYMENWARAQGHAFIRFDYRGHGASDGNFLDLAISDWTADALAVIDQLTAGPQILVGSSLGGWIMLNAACSRPERIAGLIGIAAAPDFTKELIWDKLDKDAQSAMKQTGFLSVPNPYADEPVIYPYHLVEDGAGHLHLQGDMIKINAPVRLLHGMQDEEVPWQVASRIMEKLVSDDVLLHLDKTATHRFSEPAQLDLLGQTIANLVRCIQHN
ncbi:alpha/beta fold hydrolase [Candidatus Puniceispirillum marinum]|uniref:Palmitoyl-protein thioesterase ABHD10, mitochondrial n=1 Tax=Puniceispirillum marinum (strain IMCC1322) TaxID=488538 RepID=D5BT83_PUNMI|nr:alpha/beta hydrolase [Candidatus Puniceispirillum marinum]ADE39480.1 Alpha/beta hydrolase fold protein [Candidatus Puniceispirillum marinum IMCC1322]